MYIFMKYLISLVLHLRGYFCDSMNLFRVGIHAFFVENGSLGGDSEVLYLTFSAVK